jgi:hypothetical protein
MDAAAAMDAQTAPTAAWKTTEQVFHKRPQALISCLFLLSPKTQNQYQEPSARRRDVVQDALRRLLRE